ncbi:MAG: DUF3179 domain-containing protein [Proteobacteria bacterium]|nr:DUF3179 domain-containing protein [Pseudomonadota bacterium]
MNRAWLLILMQHALLMPACLLAIIGQAHAQQAVLNGNVIDLPVVTLGAQSYQVQLTIQDGTSPLEVLVTSAVELSNASAAGASSFVGNLLSIPSIAVAGVNYWASFSLLSADPPRLVLTDAGELGAGSTVQNCTRPEPDLSNGPDSAQVVNGFVVPPADIVDGGPGPDGIPAINHPLFTSDFKLAGMQAEDLVIGVKIGEQVRAYPHRLMDYHEIVNDRFDIEGVSKDFTISYCPLTGSALLWKSFADSANTTFGVSGLLYNSNLVLYDRETGSLWSQMLEQAINGPQATRIPEKYQVLETTWGNWLAMYPQTLVLMIEETEFSFPYEFYPYGFYRSDNSVLYNVTDLSDNRLHRKERVLGITVGENSKVYPITNFASDVSVINDRVGNMDVVSVGSSSNNFGAVFNRQLEDCTVLDFSPIENQSPIVMVDNEGSQWDLFGVATSGPRAGTQLQKTNSFVAYWFAWAAFFPGAEIYP